MVSRNKEPQVRIFAYYLLKNVAFSQDEWSRLLVPVRDDLFQESSIELRIQALTLVTRMPRAFVLSCLFSQNQKAKDASLTPIHSSSSFFSSSTPATSPPPSEGPRIFLAMTLLTMAKTDISPVYQQTILDNLSEICFKHGIFVEQKFRAFSLEFWNSVSNLLLHKSTYIVNSSFLALRRLCLYHATASDIDEYESLVKLVLDQIFTRRKLTSVFNFISFQAPDHQSIAISTLGWLINLFLDRHMIIPNMDSQIVRNLVSPRTKKPTMRPHTPYLSSPDVDVVSFEDITGMVERFILPLSDLSRGEPSVVFQVSQTLAELCTFSKIPFPYCWIVTMCNSLFSLFSLSYTTNLAMVQLTHEKILGLIAELVPLLLRSSDGVQNAVPIILKALMYTSSRITSCKERVLLLTKFSKSLVELLFSDMDDFIPYLDYFLNRLRIELEPSQKGITMEFLTCFYMDLVERRKNFENIADVEDRIRDEVGWLKIGQYVISTHTSFEQSPLQRGTLPNESFLHLLDLVCFGALHFKNRIAADLNLGEVELSPNLELTIANLQNQVIKYLCSWAPKLSQISEDRTCIRMIFLLLCYLPTPNLVDCGDTLLLILTKRFINIDLEQKAGQGFLAFLSNTEEIHREGRLGQLKQDLNNTGFKYDLELVLQCLARLGSTSEKHQKKVLVALERLSALWEDKDSLIAERSEYFKDRIKCKDNLFVSQYAHTNGATFHRWTHKGRDWDDLFVSARTKKEMIPNYTQTMPVCPVDQGIGMSMPLKAVTPPVFPTFSLGQLHKGRNITLPVLPASLSSCCFVSHKELFPPSDPISVKVLHTMDPQLRTVDLIFTVTNISLMKLEKLRCEVWLGGHVTPILLPNQKFHEEILNFAPQDLHTFRRSFSITQFGLLPVTVDVSIGHSDEEDGKTSYYGYVVPSQEKQALAFDIPRRKPLISSTIRSLHSQPYQINIKQFFVPLKIDQWLFYKLVGEMQYFCVYKVHLTPVSSTCFSSLISGLVSGQNFHPVVKCSQPPVFRTGVCGTTWWGDSVFINLWTKFLEPTSDRPEPKVVLRVEIKSVKEYLVHYIKENKAPVIYSLLDLDKHKSTSFVVFCFCFSFILFSVFGILYYASHNS
eukprot:TRINITY_DN4032_c0_g1_i1.p1 TRINITY_DN4032_c0_g1~~TRINITY_DN4032_c0_g1_i1.p1  ORF type:complete len:1193 (-),score=186.41 TRINITY_DN4032_c0_g1_i1:262-3612(-)